jgi:radical SAM superfamily enzyme YgiQ (UPF0313 family)
VGFPGENQETLKNTANFLNTLSLKNLLACYHLYPILVEPLSELADPAIRNKWKLERFMDKWSHSTMNSEDAIVASNDLFREVNNVPYHYFEESNFFNRAKFFVPTRKLLFQLRQHLTIKLFENALWEQIEPILSSIAQKMNVSVGRIGESLRDEISVPSAIFS